MNWTRGEAVRKRRAISGIVSAVILFAMIFTVGTGYFLFVNTMNGSYSKALSIRASSMQNQLAENLEVVSTQNANNHLIITVTNMGGVSANITNVFVVVPSNALCTFGVGIASNGECPNTATNVSPTLPIVVSPGATSSSIDTDVLVSSGTYVIKVLTQRGSTFAATYPPTATSLAAQALSSGAIGDLYLSLGTYAYYSVTTSNCPAVGTAVQGGTSSGSCLATPSVNGCTSVGIGCSAFSIPHNFAGGVAFSVKMTDLNPTQLNITLDPFSLVNQVIEHGGGSPAYQLWYVVNNSTDVILSSYSPITLLYNTPKVVVFAALYSMDNGFSSEKLPSIQSGSTAPIFIVSHGWKGLEASKQTESAANYGQNSPYVTTLYY